MSDGQPSKEDITKALDDYKDPELGRSIVSLGQVQSIKLDGDSVAVTLGLTSFSAPLFDDAKTEVSALLKKRFPQLSKVTVKVARHERPAEKIGEIGLAAKAVIAVGSGKGGVGKSTIATTLAYGLARSGAAVGLLDADVYGPSIPHLIGSQDQPTTVGDKIQPVTADGVKVMSIGFMIPPEEAVMWRGPMLHSAITQFLGDTNWGSLDYLIIDMPPGTGDVAISLSQLLPLSGAVVVSTPQEVALLDITKAIVMFRKVNIPILGMVENMSHFICPECNSCHHIFGSGGAKRKAEEVGVPFLGEVPLNISLRVRGDEGTLTSSFEDENTSGYLEAICHNLVKNLASQRQSQPPMPSLSVLG